MKASRVEVSKHFKPSCSCNISCILSVPIVKDKHHKFHFSVTKILRFLMYQKATGSHFNETSYDSHTKLGLETNNYEREN